MDRGLVRAAGLLNWHGHGPPALLLHTLTAALSVCILLERLRLHGGVDEELEENLQLVHSAVRATGELLAAKRRSWQCSCAQSTHPWVWKRAEQ